MSRSAEAHLCSSVQDILQGEEALALWKLRQCSVSENVRLLLAGRREELEANCERQGRAPTTQERSHIVTWLQSVH